MSVCEIVCVCVHVIVCVCDCVCSLQRVEVVCSGAGDDARLAALVSSQNEVSRSQQLRVRQQLLSFHVATGERSAL